MRINREEIFGPVASVIRVKDYDEALAMANDTPFGLSAGIVTTSLKHASHFKRNSESGLVMVNLPTAGLDYHVPFGGRKKSSYGPREQGDVREGVLHDREDGVHRAVDASDEIIGSCGAQRDRTCRRSGVRPRTGSSLA